MLIHNLVATGSISYNGVNISYVTGSQTSLDGLNQFSASVNTTTGSLNTATGSLFTASGSFSTRVTNTESTASVLTTASASFAVVSSSYSSASGSLSTRVSNIEGNYATTGSNIFTGAQTVCANITSTGTIIAQTLNVQQVTSSVVYSSGSNIFGCLPSDVQQFTGSLRVTGSGPHFIQSGCIGIGTTSPTKALEIVSNISQDGIKISGTSNPRLTIVDTTNSVQFDALTTDTEVVLRSDTNHPLHLSTNGTLRLNITNAGIACFACQVCTPTLHAATNVQIGYGGAPAGTGKLFISRGDQYGLNINAQSGYVRIQGDDDLLVINRGGVDILSMSTCNHLGVRTTASPWAALRVCQCTSNNDYAVRVQAVFGINDYLDSDANRIFGGGLSETQFLNGSSSRPAMISLGGNLATSEALGVINFFRSDNASTYRSRAQIWAATNGSGCSTTLGGYITLTTADTGQTNPTQKLTIFSNGIACFACQVCAAGFYTTGNSCLGAKVAINSIIDPEVVLRVGVIGNTTDAISCSTGLRLFTSNNTAGQGVSLAFTAGSTKETGIILAAENTSGQNGDFVIRTYAGGANYPERMRITSGGNVGISTAGYDVNNTLSLGRVFGFVQDINSGYIQANMSNAGNYIVSQYAVRMHLDSALGEITFLNAGSGTAGNAVSLTPRMRITSGGIACFGGTVCAPCFATISDYRMKSNLRPIEGLSIIMNTKPYKFDYNYDCSTSFGMIAHELQEVLPEAVFGVKDGEVMQGVDYMKLLPITIKALQEQQCTICQLKSCLGIA